MILKQLDLSSLLEAIPISSGSDESRQKYHVKSIPNFEDHYFGRTNQGYPCLLLSSKKGGVKAPIHLELIEINYAVSCNIYVADGSEKIETLTAIICTASQDTVIHYFVHVCQTILNIVGISPSLDQVATVVQHLVDLFRQLTKPAKRSVVGLFGELYVIHSAKSPSRTVEAWRSATDDRFDFSVNDVRLEVKTSSTRQRKHEFSLEQCTPPQDTYGILVSLFAETSGGGLSLLELVERIKEQLDGDANLLRKFQGTVADSLGESITAALSMCFDEKLARSSLQVYELSSIPTVQNPPAEVSQVRFQSDITHTPVADATRFASDNNDLGKLLPNWM